MKKTIRGFCCVITSLCMLISNTAFSATTDITSPYYGDYVLILNNAYSVKPTQSSGILKNTFSVHKYQDESPFYDANTPIEYVQKIDSDGVNEDYMIEASAILKNMHRSTPSAKAAGIPGILFSQGSASVPETKVFETPNLETGAYETKTFILKYSGSRCHIYLDDENTINISDQKITDLGEEYDNSIYDIMSESFGTHTDIDNTGGITILVYDIQDGYGKNGSKAYTGGFFDQSDFMAGEDIIHVDTYPSMAKNSNTPANIDNARNTIIHEMQHCINYSHYVQDDENNVTQVWLDEGLSMAAEHLVLGKPLTDRITRFNSSDRVRNGAVLTYNDYSENMSVTNPSQTDIGANYGLSYLFVQYIKAQTKFLPDGSLNPEGGDKIYKHLIDAQSHSASSLENVVFVMRNMGYNVTCESLMRDFRIALVVKNPTGKHGFMGEEAFNALDAKTFDGTEANLSGSASVVIKLSDTKTFTPPASHGDNISYTGFFNDTSDTDMPDVNGDGNADFQDSNLILQHYVSSADLDMKESVIADINRDNAVDYKDALLVLNNKYPVAETDRFAFNGIVENFDGYPACSLYMSIVSGSVRPMWSWANETVLTNPAITDANASSTVAMFNSHSTSAGNSGIIRFNSTIKASNANEVVVSFDMYHDSGYPQKNDYIELHLNNKHGKIIKADTNIYRYSKSKGWQNHRVVIPVTGSAEEDNFYLELYGRSAGGNNIYIDNVTATVNTLATNVPVASADSGYLLKGSEITLSTAENNAPIYYTTDGTAPNSESTLYEGGIIIDDDTVLKAVTIVNNSLSDVSTYSYTVLEKQTLNMESSLIKAGEEVSLDIFVPQDSLICGGAFEFNYDHAALQYVGTTSDIDSCAVNAGEGKISIAFASAHILSDELLATLKFNVSTNAGIDENIGLSIANLSLCDADTVDLITETEPITATLTVSDKDLLLDNFDYMITGETVDVSANILPLSALDTANIIFALYDNSGNLIGCKTEYISFENGSGIELIAKVPYSGEFESIKLIAVTDMESIYPLKI